MITTNIIKNKSTTATPNITPTTINLPSMNLSQDFLQMNSLLRPLLNHTTEHHKTYMVSDAGQFTGQLQVPLISILLNNNNIIKSLPL
jgi:hypothetical protein